MNENAPTSTTLLRAAQCGDNSAWRQVQQLYTPLVYFWCRRMNVAPKDTVDVVANVFGTASIQLKGFEHNGRKGAFRKWLRLITQHEIADLYRAAGSQLNGFGGTTAQERLEQIPYIDPNSREENSSEEVALLYHQALELVRSEFSDRDNQIFRRVVANGEASKHVAEDMALPSYVIHKVVSRIKRRLRDKLGDEIDD